MKTYNGFSVFPVTEHTIYCLRIIAFCLLLFFYLL